MSENEEPARRRIPILAKFRRTNKTLGEKLTGPAGSFLLHVVVLLLLFKFLVFVPERRPDHPGPLRLDPARLSEPLDPVPPDDPRDELALDEPLLAANDPIMVTEVFHAALPSAVPTRPTGPTGPAGPTSLPDPPDPPPTRLSDPPGVGHPPDFAQRCTDEDRRAARRLNGGDEHTEAAAMKALRWLKESQLPDGSWPQVKEAMTGMALLVFMAHCEMPESEEFGDTVRKGIQFLLASQKADGRFGSRAYTHGIATYAMAEAYAMTEIPDLKDSMEKALQVIIDGQQESGSFDYGYKKGGRTDLSVAGWQYQALKAGKMAGAELGQLDDALKLSVKGLRFHHNGTGFGYSGPGATTSMTSVGALCMQLLGYGDDHATQAGLEYLKTALKDGWAGSSQYAWYYATQAKFHEGGKEWKRWNGMMKRELLANQAADGHWEADVHGAGPVFSTTLCALQLMVYYRFLPSFQHDAVNPVIAPASPVDDLINVPLYSMEL